VELNGCLARLCATPRVLTSISFPAPLSLLLFRDDTTRAAVQHQLSAMAPKRKARKDEDAPQPVSKRQKAALETSESTSKQPSVSRRNRATKEAAPEAPTTANPTLAYSTTATDVASLLHGKHGAESKKRPRLKPRSRPPRKPASKAPHAVPKPRDLLSLPLELQEHIFLYTSAKDTASLRRVCKTLDVVVRGSARYLARNFSRKEWKRIQHEVDEFASLKTPTDLDSLMNALHVWTKRRDTFGDRDVAADSAMKLMMHCLVRDGPIKDYQAIADTYDKIIDWGELAAHIIEIWRESRYGPDGQIEEYEIDLAFKFLVELDGPGLLAYNDYDKLFGHLRHPELQEESHRLGGRNWSSRALERLRFPLGRMTPLLHYPSFSQLPADEPVNSDAYVEERSSLWDYVRGQPTRPLLEPTHGDLRLIRYLRLPELPNAVSCYYLNDSWSRKEVKKLLALLDTTATTTRPVGISPLLKAAILERVMLF